MTATLCPLRFGVFQLRIRCVLAELFVPAVIDDPELRLRLTRVYVDCGKSYTEAARRLCLDKHSVRRLLLQRHGPIGKTRSRLELALDAYETENSISKHIQNAKQTSQIVVPELAEEVLRYVLQAVEAQRGGSQRR